MDKQEINALKKDIQKLKTAKKGLVKQQTSVGTK